MEGGEVRPYRYRTRRVSAADAKGVSLCAIPASHHLTLWSLESSEDAHDVVMQ